MINSRRRSRRGFSLIEVMTAAALFSVGLAAVFTAWRSLGIAIDHQRRLGHAALIAQSTLADLQARPKTHADLNQGVHGPRVVNADGLPVSSSTIERYNLQWTVKNEVPVPGSREVTVIITWQEMAGPRSFALVVYRS